MFFLLLLWCTLGSIILLPRSRKGLHRYRRQPRPQLMPIYMQIRMRTDVKKHPWVFGTPTPGPLSAYVVTYFVDAFSKFETRACKHHCTTDLRTKCLIS